MASELIVLSSDDEDEAPLSSWLAKTHKRIKVLDADNDVTVIEKAPCLEGQTVMKSPLIKPPPRDDDCCILNYDPENNVHLPDFQAHDADDLVVVGERGPVACRDFPHARHLCVKFPFTTTSHEKHCEQCHCYVCDVVAPCLLWGRGKQSNDHCHAFDKDEKWKMLRTHARSLATKPTAPSLAPTHRGHATQPQLKTFTYPPLRVTLTTTGVKTSTNHANANSVNRGPTNMSALPGAWQPYVPSKLGTVLTNTPRVGTAYPGPNVVPPANNRMRVHSSSAMTTSCNSLAMTTSCNPQQMIHQPPSNSVLSHNSIRNTLPRHGAITYTSALQSETHMTNFTNPPQQQYQGHRVEVPSVAPCNYMEDSGGITQTIPARPAASPLNKLGKDLMTLQSFLMEGISRQSQGQSTCHGTSMAETGCVQSSLCRSGDSTSKWSSWNREMEGLYNPFEPSEMPACNNVGVGVVEPETTGTHVTVKIGKSVGSMPEPITGSKEIPDQPLCTGSGIVVSSSLDQILAGFDDDFWTLLEPTYPGF